MKKRIIGCILLLTVLLSGCGILNNQGSKVDREKIEKDLDFLSEVYPTEKVSDLFEKFPNGFGISYTISEKTDAESIEESISHNVDLIGDKTTKEIRGYYYQRGPGPEPEDGWTKVPIRYTDEEGIVKEDGTPINETVSKIQFLFTNLSLNQETISKFKFKNYFKNPVADNDSISYTFTNSWIASQLKANENENLKISFEYLHKKRRFSSLFIIASENKHIIEAVYEK